jgi:hypothetical protein
MPKRTMANVLSQLDPIYSTHCLVDNYVDTWVWPVLNVFTSGTKHKECIRNPFRTVIYSCETKYKLKSWPGFRMLYIVSMNATMLFAQSMKKQVDTQSHSSFSVYTYTHTHKKQICFYLLFSKFSNYLTHVL